MEYLLNHFPEENAFASSFHSRQFVSQHGAFLTSLNIFVPHVARLRFPRQVMKNSFSNKSFASDQQASLILNVVLIVKSIQKQNKFHYALMVFLLLHV